jgi:hypothetical protein
LTQATEHWRSLLQVIRRQNPLASHAKSTAQVPSPATQVFSQLQLALQAWPDPQSALVLLPGRQRLTELQ